MLLIYNDEKYNMYELFVNTVQEKAILYDLKEKIQMFYNTNFILVCKSRSYRIYCRKNQIKI